MQDRKEEHGQKIDTPEHYRAMSKTELENTRSEIDRELDRRRDEHKRDEVKETR